MPIKMIGAELVSKLTHQELAHLTPEQRTALIGKLTQIMEHVIRERIDSMFRRDSVIVRADTEEE